jgi:hypothetical protein
MTAFVAAFVVSLRIWGVPTDRDQVLLWVGLGMVVTGLARGDLRVGRLVLDWTPFVVALLAYDRTRGLADGFGRPVLVGGLAHAERFLFGGTVPTVWLQHHIHQRGAVAWWEAPLTLIYASHFFVPIIVPAVLWLRDRPAWLRYTTRFLALTVMGLATYVLVPAAPPWLAAKMGELAPVARTTSRGWSVLGLRVAGDVLIRGQGQVNRVAALPSMHAGYSVFVAWFLWGRTQRPIARALLVAYPLAMGFTLVLCGEHYVIDLVLGAAYVAVVVVVGARVEGALRRWRDQRDPASAAGARGRSPS